MKCDPLQYSEFLFQKRRTNIKKLLLFCVAIYFGLFLSLYLNLLTLAIFAFCVYLVISLDEKSLFCLLLFLFPYASIFKIESISTSLFTLIETLVVLKMFFQKKSISLYILLPLLCLTIVCSITLNSLFGFFEIFKVIMALLLFFFFAKNYSSDDFKDYFVFYLIGLFSSTFMGFFKGYIPRLSELTGDVVTKYIGNYAEGTLISKIRFSGLNKDPNYYSIMLIPAAVILFQSFFARRGKHLLINIILFALVSLFGLLTLSKSFFLVYTAVVALILLLNIRKSPLKVVLVVSLVLLVVLGNPYNLFSDMLLRFDTMSSGGDISSLTTGRSDIWKMYIESIRSSWFRALLGNGIDAGYLNGIAAHNLYIESIYKIGFVGLTLFLICYLSIFVQFGRKGKKNLISYLPLISLIVLYTFLAGLTAFEAPFYMMVAFGFYAKNYRNAKKSIVIRKFVNRCPTFDLFILSSHIEEPYKTPYEARGDYK